MNTKLFIIVIGAIGSIVALWVAHSQFVELELIRDQLAMEMQRRDRPVPVDPKVETLRALIAVRESEIEALKAAAISNLSVSSSAGENSVEIEEWLERIKHLSEYLSTHSDLGIPEMEYLTPSDWLGVTNSVVLETEADYRVALANLRQQAKSQVAPKILAALRGYLEASNGEPPLKIAKLFKYAEPTLGREIFERYRVNPSGNLPTMQTNGNTFLVENHSPDELWDTTFSFASDGSFMYQGNADIEPMEKAITLFEEEHDRKPDSGKELEPFFGNGFYRKRLDEKLRAMNTRIQF